MVVHDESYADLWCGRPTFPAHPDDSDLTDARTPDPRKTLRDEARVQAHLGSLEVHGRLALLDGRLGQFTHRAEKVADAADEAGDVRVALSMLGETLADGHRKVRTQLDASA